MMIMTLLALPPLQPAVDTNSEYFKRATLVISGEIFVSWLLTPLGAIFFSYILYRVIAFFFRKFLTLATQDMFIRVLTWFVIVYSSYSLGANNVANVTGVFTDVLLSPLILSIIGGLSIAVGIFTTNQKVLYTVGKGILR